jgi:hypothetical protein
MSNDYSSCWARLEHAILRLRKCILCASSELRLRVNIACVRDSNTEEQTQKSMI